MHAVPLLKDAMNGQVKKDIHRLIGRQASFNDEDLGKRKISTWEIKELDFESNETGHTLWDFIMNIPRQDDLTKKLFHSVDYLHSNHSTVVFTCMPTLESEARNMVASLITYLKHHHGDEVVEFFTKDAQLRATDSYWDDDPQCVRNKDDEHVSSLLHDVDDDYVLPPITKGSMKTQVQQPPERPIPGSNLPPSLQCNTFGEDDDSIDTFRRYQTQDSASVHSEDSATTIATLTSCLTALEHLLCTHNISVPTNSPLSTVHNESLDTAGGPPGDRAPGRYG